MQVTLIGAGNMGSGLPKQLAKAGHQGAILSRDAEQAAELARQTGSWLFEAGSDQDASEVVLVATAYADAVDALRQIGDLSGKIIIDITNPLTADYMGLILGHSTSAAEEIARVFPEANLVKVFNTMFAQVLQNGPDFGAGQVVPVCFAGDNAEAKDVVRALIESAGFAAVDAGPLKNARYL